MNSEPSKVPNVCAEVETMSTDQRLRISWDRLPCHLQNGANITHYIIRYSLTSGEEVGTIDNSGTDASCAYISSGDSWQCSIVAEQNKMYTFQVAAHSNIGVGRFSDPVCAMLGTQGDKYYVYSLFCAAIICTPAT